jgi:hypothetical protein
MTFEEWFDKDDANYVEDLARAAYEAGIQEGIHDLVKAHQIRPRGKSMLVYLPEGYVLVPVEPTEKMEEAGLEVHPWDYTEDMQKIYKAMIQAAQEEE